MLTDKQKLSYANSWRHYMESLIYVECLAHGMKKIPVLEIEDDMDCFSRPGLIHIGLGSCYGESKETLFAEMHYNLGHEMQHILSTTAKDWVAANKLCINTALQRLSVRVFGKTRRLSKESDYEAFFKDLASRGIFVSLPLLTNLSHFLLNVVEDGRIETIRTKLHPGFGNYRKIWLGRYWNEQDIRDESCSYDPDHLTSSEQLHIVLGQIYYLARLGIYQKGFLEIFEDTSVHKYVKSLIPDISKAVLGKSCKDAMDHGRAIYEKILDWVLDVCTVEADAKALEELLNKLLEALLDEASKSEYSASPNTEEKGDGLPAESLFGPTELEVEVTQEEYDELMKEAGSGESDETAQPSVRIKVADDPDDEVQDSQEGCSDEKSEKIGKEAKQGDSSSDSGSDNKSKEDPSDTPSNSDPGSFESGQMEIADSLLNESKGHDAHADSAGSCSNTDEIEAGIRQAMEAAAEHAKGDYQLAEADAELDEKFRDAASKYTAVEPENVDLSDVDSLYDCDVTFKESTRVYDPVGRLPLELENKGKSLDHKIDEIVKNKQAPDQRYLKSGMLDTRRLTNLAVGDLNVFKKKGEPNKTDVAAFLLMDNSGSMGDGPGSTRFACCNAFAVLEEGFKRHMPLKIAAFDASGSDYVSHEVVKEFDEVIGPNLSFNFRDLGRSGCGNKDGYSIRVATRQLLSRPEKDKLLIIASDGLPTCYGGGNAEGCRDVKSAVAEARKAGVRTIGMYMFHEQDHRDFAQYQDMYGPEIIFASLDEIEDELSRILKRYF